MTIKPNKITSLLLISAILTITGCVSSSMEYRSATTAARSEKNLKKAEEFGLKALNIEADSSNAHIPYFLAIEVYKPRKEWIKMAEMLDEAVRRNPTQELERPIILDKENITREVIKRGMIAMRNPKCIRKFDAEVMVLHHPTTIRVNYQPVVHCEMVRQSARITKMNKKRLRTGDKAIVTFEFMFHPEYLEKDLTIIFREGKTKGIGKILKIY